MAKSTESAQSNRVRYSQTEKVQMAKMCTVIRVKPAGSRQISPHLDRTPPSEATLLVVHTRKSHKKSRSGCKNCKIRRIKCDETREGGCVKCADRQLVCDYNQSRIKNVRELVEIAPPVVPDEQAICLTHHQASYSSISGAMPSDLRSCLSPEDASSAALLSKMTPYLETLHHFQTLTYATISPPSSQGIIRQKVLGIAMAHPYLLHGLLAVASSHLQHLLPSNLHPVQNRQHALAEGYHWEKTIKLYRAEISSPENFGPRNMDALLSTCMMLSLFSFVSKEPSPGQSFVYADPNDVEQSLNWMRNGCGFKALFAAFGDELLCQSVWLPSFREVDDYELLSKGDTFDTGVISRSFMALCEIMPDSTAETNVYYRPLQLVLFQLRVETSIESFNKLISFMDAIEQPYFALIKSRDPRALLIMSYWIAQICFVRLWWIQGRAVMELTAILAYLSNHPDHRLRSLLEFPASVVEFELQSVDSSTSATAITSTSSPTSTSPGRCSSDTENWDSGTLFPFIGVEERY